MFKGFLEINGTLLHYARQGEGPPLVMLHAAPCSLRVMEPLQNAWSDHFTTIAFDLPGFGLSGLPDREEISTADLADAIAEGIRLLSLPKVMLYGRHTGAGVAVELARRHPDLCSFVLTDGFPVFAKPYTEERLAEYLTPITPTWDGGHLTWAWFRYREQHMFWPWDRPLLSQRADTDLPDIDFLYRGATELLTARETYAKVYASAFRHPGLAMIDKVEVPVIYGNRPGDSQYKTVPLYPESAKVHVFARDHEKAALEELDLLIEHAPDQPAPAYVGPDFVTRSSWRDYITTKNGATYCRAEAMDREGVLTLYLPDLPGSIDLHVEEIRALSLQGPVLAIDPWGNGQSILRPPEPVSIDIWINQIIDVITRLAVDRLYIHAHGTSAAIALELDRRMPELIAGMTLRSPPALEMDDPADFADDYAPDISPEWAGGNFLKLWHHLRDQELWWPWNRRTLANAKTTEPRIDPAWLHRRAVVLLRQPTHYRTIWQLVLRYPVAERLASVKASCAITSDPGDVFAFAAERAKALARAS
ncbi:alpha/beta fold hydrolase [Rhizobium sp. SGZ-381]|uniref:alpha/beta fold hydrolase n=1 Tax=Rhizobium sp. SGZ-381 TaxID=3342800 RepID=UPI00366F9409